MTDKGDYITVEADETDLTKLLEVVRNQQRPVRILSHGHTVAEISPVLLKQFGPTDPQLKAKIIGSGHELTSEEDWPDNGG